LLTAGDKEERIDAAEGLASSKGEDGNVNEDGLPQAKEKMDMSLRMAYLKQRRRWKCQRGRLTSS
jgi:hypothetical protein